MILSQCSGIYVTHLNNNCRCHLRPIHSLEFEETAYIAFTLLLPLPVGVFGLKDENIIIKYPVQH